MNDDWEEFRADFCHSFSLIKRINSLPIDILDFEQLEKESIGAAWARFLRLLASSPDLSIFEDVLLNIFCSDIDMESALKLDNTTGGSFAHLTPAEGREILDNFLRNSSFPTDQGEPRRKESTSSHESLSTIESELSSFTSQYSSVEPSPEPQTPKEEEIQPSEFSSRFKDDPSGNTQNTSNYFRHNKPTESLCLYKTIDGFSGHTPAIDWSKEARRTSEAIRISPTSMTIPCFMKGNAVEALHDPFAEVCIIPECLFDTLVGNKPLTPTDKYFKSPS